MSGWAEWKPKLRWLMSRMRLLRPSRRPLLSPRRMSARWRRIVRASLTKGARRARPVIDALVREWFEQTLVEVVLCARASRWTDEQLAALLSPTSFSAALLPRQLIYAILQKRLAQKLGAPRA
jgi:hypothetical protein